MCIFLKNFKSLLTSIAVLLILMTSLTPCFGIEQKKVIYERNKKYLTVYEQYIQDFLEQLAELYTPEKYFPQKRMNLFTNINFEIFPDGSLTFSRLIDSSSDYANTDLWFLCPIYLTRLTNIAPYHDLYIKNMIITNKAKPFPEDFGDYIDVNLIFTHWNEKFRKKVFYTTIEPVEYSSSLKNGRMRSSFKAYIDRSNDSQKSKIKYPISIPDNIEFEFIK